MTPEELDALQGRLLLSAGWRDERFRCVVNPSVLTDALAAIKALREEVSVRGRYIEDLEQNRTALQRHLDACTLRAEAAEEAEAALKWFVKHADGLKADVRNGHQSRRHEASEWMREDDRDFRTSLDNALDAARAAIRGEQQ